MVKAAFFKFRLFSKVKAYLNSNQFERLIQCFISSRLDYYNSLYVGVSQVFLSSSRWDRETLQNAAVHVFTGKQKWDHISPILASLRWLTVHFRTEFKILVFVFKPLSGLAPPIISDLHQPYVFSRSQIC